MSLRPNIVFIVTDQQRIDTIRALGYRHMETPNLDRLVERGVAFTNMHVTSPSCAPSRASLFTGTYPHTNGVFRNDEPWSWSWVGLLADAGYRCVNVGKMHTMPAEGAFGFHERHVVENKDRVSPRLPFYLDQWDKAIWTRGEEKPSKLTYRRLSDYAERMGAFVWELDEGLHADNFVGDLACMWLDRYTGSEPIFLQVGFPGPHPPYDPTARWLACYEGKALPEAIRGYDLDTQPMPLRTLRAHHQGHEHDAVVHLADPSDEQLYRQRQHYYANVSMIDEQVGNIVDALERRGILDDTIVIFTSDHGDCLNDHGHIQKWTMYDASVRVPAVIAGPGITDRHVDSLAAHFDLGPTILEAAGVSAPDWMEARSLWPILNGESDAVRDRVFSEHAGDKILTGTAFMTMIRIGDWKLVHFVDHDEGQLFDLDGDPNETRNLWHEPDQAERRDAMIADILRWRIESDCATQGFRRALATA